MSSFVIALSGDDRKNTMTRRSLSSGVKDPSSRGARSVSKIVATVCQLVSRLMPLEERMSNYLSGNGFLSAKQFV